MNRDAELFRLLSWLSPSFPIGAFAYSHGLERAIHDGAIKDRTSLLGWLSALIACGSGWNDAVLLAEAWRTAGIDGGTAVTELAEAMAGSRERHMETTLQGGAFMETVVAWGPIFPNGAKNADSIPYPVAIGLAAARHGVGLHPALTAYLHAFASNLVQATVRLVPLGQRDGVATLAALEPVIMSVAKQAATSTLDDLGSCTIMSEIASMKHETQYSRVFRS